MTVVLDGGGVSGLAADRALVNKIRREGAWPPDVSAAVLVECLTGDHRRDHATDRVLGMCMIRDVDERQARRASALRTASGRAGDISAVDALVVALAETVEDAVIYTSDPVDIADLVDQSDRRIRVVPA